MCCRLVSQSVGLLRSRAVGCVGGPLRLVTSIEMSQSEGPKGKNPVAAKEDFEQVAPGKALKQTNRNKNERRYLRLPSHKKNCTCPDCKKPGSKSKSRSKKKPDESVIGEKEEASEESESERRSMGSTTERAQQRALKVDAPNRIVFRCPNCDAALRMHVTKKKEWDDSDSLSDAKDDWSRRNND